MNAELLAYDHPADEAALSVPMACQTKKKGKTRVFEEYAGRSGRKKQGADVSSVKKMRSCVFGVLKLFRAQI